MVNEKRLIDANALQEVLKNEECNCEVFPWAVDNAPTVDAVEVVRCAFCKACVNINSESKAVVWCNRHRMAVSPHDFCSYGERRKCE